MQCTSGPGDHDTLQDRNLTLDSVVGWIAWYREQGGPFYIGFSLLPDCCWLYPVYLGYYNTNGDWRVVSLGDARRTFLAP